MLGRVPPSAAGAFLPIFLMNKRLLGADFAWMFGVVFAQAANDLRAYFRGTMAADSKRLRHIHQLRSRSGHAFRQGRRQVAGK